MKTSEDTRLTVTVSDEDKPRYKAMRIAVYHKSLQNFKKSTMLNIVFVRRFQLETLCIYQKFHSRTISGFESFLLYYAFFSRLHYYYQKIETSVS